MALVRVHGLTKTYTRGHWLGRRKPQVRALDQIDLTIPAGSTVALVGESGSGKSTLARCVACLEDPDSGELWFNSHNLLTLSAKELIPFRRQIQLVLQDSSVSLNPRFSAAEIVAEPLHIQRSGTREERHERALALMEQVGFSPTWQHRLPMELSGGQRQRLTIARALAVEPKFLILDEPLAGLDRSIQAQIINLLMDLQELHSLTYLYVTHDLSLAAHISDFVAVMYEGRIVERATTSELFGSPEHPQSRALLRSMQLST